MKRYAHLYEPHPFRIPENLPDDVTCVRTGSNECRPGWQEWHSMPNLPGHVLVPMSYLEHTAMGATDSSPFYACELKIVTPSCIP